MKTLKILNNDVFMTSLIGGKNILVTLTPNGIKIMKEMITEVGQENVETVMKELVDVAVWYTSGKLNTVWGLRCLAASGISFLAGGLVSKKLNKETEDK